jgi:hypothetical protein
MNEFVNLSIEDLLGCIHGKDKEGNDFKVVYPPHERVKDEFNKFVNQEISERKKKSTVSALRDFHNHIKRTLILQVTKLYQYKHKGEPVNLLDIAVGRGGDMWKWNEAGIANVFGFDKSNDSINSINPFDQGAKERYQKSKDKVKTNIEYSVGDATKPTLELIKSIGVFMDTYGLLKYEPKFRGFQIISCQLAMHYFFQSEEALNVVFSTFAPMLKSGGYFIGTTVNGKYITDLLQEKTTFDSALLNIRKDYKAKAPKKEFGNKYTFLLNDGFDKGNYFNSMGASTEYLVNMETLKRVAALYNLIPVYTNFFNPIPQTKNFTTSTDFISFDDIYKLPRHGLWKGRYLSPDELIINNLYTTFIFIKR